MQSTLFPYPLASQVATETTIVGPPLSTTYTPIPGRSIANHPLKLFGLSEHSGGSSMSTPATRSIPSTMPSPPRLPPGLQPACQQPGRRDQPTLGNATFTYDIHVTQQTVYDASGNSSLHWMLVNGDGTRLDFGATGNTPAPGIYCQFTPISGGFTVTHAGPPEAIYEAGNYTYNFQSSDQVHAV